MIHGGSTPGQTGTSLPGLQLIIDNVPFKAHIDSVRINKTQISCDTFDFAGLGYVNTNAVASWDWNFGDGTSHVFTQDTGHRYTVAGPYTVKLIITDINGCRDSITTDIQADVLDFDFSYQIMPVIL